MVIQWSIVDLRVNGDIELLDRHVRMKRRFNRIFTTFLIGVFFVSAAIFVYVITLTTKFVFRLSNQLFTGKITLWYYTYFKFWFICLCNCRFFDRISTSNRNALWFYFLHWLRTLYNVCFTVEVMQRENWLQNAFPCRNHSSTHLILSIDVLLFSISLFDSI